MGHLLAWTAALWGALAAWGETVQRRTALDTPWKVLPIYGGGFMQNVVIAPSDPNVWYTYVDVGGPYRSDDAGKSWYPLHANLTIGQRDLNAGMVRTLDVDPRDANAFVMAAGDGPWRKGGVFVSRDGGISFRQTLSARYHANGPRRMMGLVLARNPAHPDELVAGSESDGLFLSRDNGETWKNVGLTNHWFSDVRYDATVTNRVWACAPWSLKHDYDAQESYRIRLGGRRTRERGFYRSDDGGETWTRVSAESPYEVRQIWGADRLVGVYGVFAQVDVAPGAKPLLAAASDDGGATWHDFGEGLRPYVPRGRWSYINEGTYHALAAGPDFWLIGSNAGRIYRRGAKDACWTPVERETLRLRDPKTEGHMRRLEASRQMEELSTIVVDPHRPDHWLTTDWSFIGETSCSWSRPASCSTPSTGNASTTALRTWAIFTQRTGAPRIRARRPGRMRRASPVPSARGGFSMRAAGSGRRRCGAPRTAASPGRSWPTRGRTGIRASTRPPTVSSRWRSTP